MTQVTAGPSPTKKQLQTLTRGFLLSILPATGWEVVEGQINRVPEPTDPMFVAVIAGGVKRLATVVDTWSDDIVDRPTTLQHEQSVEAHMQLQVFGAQSMDGVNLITTLLRSSYGVTQFLGSGIAPLYCDDGQQVPFIDGERQYEDRWILEAVFQMSVQISTTQQFADTLEVDLALPVDLEPVD
jgi:hypothetical protein